MSYITIHTADQISIPPGGWQFFQPQTAWHLPSPSAWTFRQAVTMIQKMRSQNPAVVGKHGLKTDYNSIAQELVDYTNQRLGNAAPTLPKTTPPQPAASLLGGAVAEIKKLAAGAALLLDWEESGLPPVAAEVANARAFTCRVCPKNKPTSLSAWFTQPVSQALQGRIARLNGMNLRTDHDDSLGVCEACICPLKLKVWTPPELVLKRLKPEQKADLHPDCWILKL